MFPDILDIYLCASLREGVPQAVMQAMLMGKAVISTEVGGIPDLNRENNLLLDSRTPYRMVRRLGRTGDPYH